MTTLNPVLRRELLERWRGRRAFWVITGYVLILAVVMVLLYWVGEQFLEQQARWGGGAAFAAGPTIGRFLFENVLAFVLLLVLFIAPGYAAAQIAGERERRTLSLLQVTLVRPVDIVLGKLGASLAWLLLLVVAALPFGAAAFFLGGVTAGDLGRGVAVVLVVAVSVAAMGLGISATTRKTTAAVVLTYALVLGLTLGTIFVSVVEAAVQRFDFDADERPVALYLNPFYGLADSVRANARFGSELPSVLTAFGAVLPNANQDAMFIERGFDVAVPEGAVEQLPGVAVPVRRGERELVWVRTLAAYVVLGVLGIAVATRRVRVGKGPGRRPSKEDDPTVVAPTAASPAGTPAGAPAGTPDGPATEAPVVLPPPNPEERR